MGLTGFERGAVFFRNTDKDFELKLRHGSFKGTKAVRFLCGRILDIRPNEVQIVDDLRKCRWVRNHPELKRIQILSHAYIPFLNKNTLRHPVFGQHSKNST